MRVTVNQPGQQGRAAQIDCLDAGWRVRLHSRRRTDFLDLAVLDQHGRGREHVPGPGIEQLGRFDENVTGAAIGRRAALLAT